MNSNYPDLYNTSVEKFTSFFVFPFSIPFKTQFSSNTIWGKSDFSIPKKPDEISDWKYQKNYAEYMYFHDYVREFIFPNSKQDTAFSEDSVLLYKYKLKTKPKITLTYKTSRDAAFDSDKSEKTISAWIQGIYLYLYPNDIGILTLQTGNTANIKDQAQNEILHENDEAELNGAEILLFNDMFRRIYPSYFENEKNGLFEQIKNKEFPWAVTIETPDELLYEYKSKDLAQTTHLKPNLLGKLTPVLSSYVKNLLDSFFSHSGNNAYVPILDDRMLVYSYIAFPMKAQETLTPPKDLEVFFSRFLYVESPESNYRYEEEFMKKLLAQNTYKRWEHYNTKIGFSRYSGTFLYFGHKEFLYRPFASMYYQMFLLIVYYRACLLQFADQIALVSKGFLDKDIKRSKPPPTFLKQLCNLHGRFMKFMNIYWFKEVTNQDQGIELFALMRRAFDLDDMYTQVKEEIERADDFAQLLHQKKIECFQKWMTVFGAIISLAAMIAALIPLFKQTP